MTRVSAAHPLTRDGRRPTIARMSRIIVLGASVVGLLSGMRLVRRGHDVTVVGRSQSNGECRQCARDYAREKYGYKTIAEDLITSCRRGHPRERTVIVTRTRNGKEQQEKKCLDCRADSLARHAAKKAAGG